MFINTIISREIAKVINQDYYVLSGNIYFNIKINRAVLFLPTTGSFGRFARILLNYSRKMAAAGRSLVYCPA